MGWTSWHGRTLTLDAGSGSYFNVPGRQSFAVGESPRRSPCGRPISFFCTAAGRLSTNSPLCSTKLRRLRRFPRRRIWSFLNWQELAVETIRAMARSTFLKRCGRFRHRRLSILGLKPDGKRSGLHRRQHQAAKALGYRAHRHVARRSEVRRVIAWIGGLARMVLARQRSQTLRSEIMHRRLLNPSRGDRGWHPLLLPALEAARADYTEVWRPGASSFR